jgi:hypothetical protein
LPRSAIYSDENAATEMYVYIVVRKLIVFNIYTVRSRFLVLVFVTLPNGSSCQSPDFLRCSRPTAPTSSADTVVYVRYAFAIEFDLVFVSSMYLLTPFMISCENFEAFKKVRFRFLCFRHAISILLNEILYTGSIAIGFVIAASRLS